MVQGIQKRIHKNKTITYRVQISESDGFPPKSKSFPTLQEAKDWQKQRHLDWWRTKIGKYGLTKISSDLIAGCRQELAAGVTSKQTKRTPATVNRYLASLSTVMTYAVRECGWIMDNPCLRVAKFTESKGRDRIASRDECPRLLEECKNSRNEHLLPVVLLAITTGMRQGEILGLTWDCIDLDRQVINLKETKNGRPRTVSIVDQSLDLLKEHHSKRSPYTPYVFPAKKRFGKISIRKAWDEAVKRAGIDNLRFHDLRHTFATYALSLLRLWGIRLYRCYKGTLT